MRVQKSAPLPQLLLLIALITACSARQTVSSPTDLATKQPAPSSTPWSPTLALTSVSTRTAITRVTPAPSPIEESTTEPSPTGALSPTEAPSPTAPQAETTRIQFEAGATSEVLTGHVEARAVEQYVVQASAEQVMHVRADSPEDSVLLDVTDSDGAPIEGRAAGRAFWHGKLPATQDYLIKVASSGEAADYQLSVIIYARITFDPGVTSVTLSSHLEDYETDHYVLQAQEGETMDVVAEAPKQVGLTIWGVDGIPLKRYVDEERTWRGELTKTQDYFIAVNSIEATDYTLDVVIR